MRQLGTWLILASMMVALLAGGLFTTAAWLYQGGFREPPATVAPESPPVAPIERPPAVEPSGTEVPVAYVPNVADGQQLYSRFCDSCHPGGGSGLGPSLRGAELEAEFADDEALKRVTREGVGTMPAFRQLTDRQLDDIVAYIRTLE
jgi:mono/diheme cytochrome c family protein